MKPLPEPPRQQISNPVHRSASHVKDQSSKAEPVNTSRKEPIRTASMAAASKRNNPRPGLERQNTSYQTRYMDMLLGLDTIPRLHNILASFFTWILLAGFVVFPGTFTSIQALESDPDIANNAAATEILSHVKSIPLLIVAAVCCGIGVIGMLWLSWRWRGNYVWLLNRLYLPGVMNAFAGLIATLTSVYQSNNGDWSVTARVSVIVEGVCMIAFGVMFLLISQILLRLVRRRHDREVERMQKHSDEGLIGRIKEKANEPGLEPGSIV